MSKMKAIKTFRDLPAFLTIIPLGKTKDSIVTSTGVRFLFPLICRFMGMLAAASFFDCSIPIARMLAFINSHIQFSTGFLLKLLPAIMTLAFILVLTMLQHFDGLVNMDYAIGAGGVKERSAAAQVWTITYKGAVLAIFVEFLALLGLFFINASNSFGAIIGTEVAAKLGIVLIAVLGKLSHSGLGSIFVESVKRKRSLAVYFLGALIVYPLSGLTAVWLILACFLLDAFMSEVVQKLSGRAAGEAIGVTNLFTIVAVLLLMS